MKFIHPGWFWALVALPLAFALVLWDERRRKRRFARFALESTWRSLAPEIDFSTRLKKAVVWMLAFAFAVAALARPQWGMHEETAKITGMDVMFVLDISNSMETEDVAPSRLQKAKHLIKSMTERISGDRVGLVTFAASASVSCPLTTDSDYMLGELQMMAPAMAATQGTDIGLGLETARRALDRGGEQGPPDAGVADSSHAIVLVSDGENWEDGAIDAARRIKSAGIKLFVFGVGTQRGGPVPERDENGALLAYKKDHKGQPVISKFKPDTLEEIASAGGGKYWNASENEAEVDAWLQQISGLSRGQIGERKYAVFEDRYQYPLFVAVLLLLLEMAIPARRMVKETERAPAGAAGTLPLAGWLLVFLLGTAGLAYSPSARAAPLNAYLDNEKGIKDFRAGKIDEAKKEFGNAQAVVPDSPELLFNEGAVQLGTGDSDAAIESFQEAVKRTHGSDPKLNAKALYNLGEALTKKGDFKGAAKSYIGAIGQSQLIKDAALEAEARKNLELLTQQEQKQKQKQKQQQDQQKEQQQQNKDQQGQQKPQAGNQKNDQQQQAQNQQNKDQQNQDKDQKKDQENNQPQRYKEDQQQQFRSQKLTPEDADRVMQELRHQERELEAKLKKKTGVMPNDHDW